MMNTTIKLTVKILYSRNLPALVSVLMEPPTGQNHQPVPTNTSAQINQNSRLTNDVSFDNVSGFHDTAGPRRHSPGSSSSISRSPGSMNLPKPTENRRETSKPSSTSPFPIHVHGMSASSGSSNDLRSDQFFSAEIVPPEVQFAPSGTGRLIAANFSNVFSSMKAPGSRLSSEASVNRVSSGSSNASKFSGSPMSAHTAQFINSSFSGSNDSSTFSARHGDQADDNFDGGDHEIGQANKGIQTTFPTENRDESSGDEGGRIGSSGYGGEDSRSGGFGGQEERSLGGGFGGGGSGWGGSFSLPAAPFPPSPPLPIVMPIPRPPAPPPIPSISMPSMPAFPPFPRIPSVPSMPAIQFPSFPQISSYGSGWGSGGVGGY